MQELVNFKIELDYIKEFQEERKTIKEVSLGVIAKLTNTELTKDMLNDLTNNVKKATELTLKDWSKQING